MSAKNNGRQGPRDLHSSRLDEINHRDTGCDLHSACLTCPFARCKYDERVVDQDRGTRNAEIVRLSAEGWTAREIAERVGISPRVVWYVTQELRVVPR